MAKKTLQLGRPVRQPASPGKAQLDRVPNPHPDTDYVARFTAPEFTCFVRSPASRISPFGASTTCRANGCWSRSR